MIVVLVTMPHPGLGRRPMCFLACAGGEGNGKKKWNESVPKWNEGDVLGIAVDLDEGMLLYLSRANGPWENEIDEGVVSGTKISSAMVRYALHSLCERFMFRLRRRPRGTDDAKGAAMLIPLFAARGLPSMDHGAS